MASKRGGRKDKGSKREKNQNERLEIDQLDVRCLEEIDVSKILAFKDLPLSTKTLEGLTNGDFKVPTEIQRQSLPFALKHQDILGAAKTGSGKTLAFIIPILEHLYRQQCMEYDGMMALVVTPVRELAYQIFAVLRQVGKAHKLSAGLIIGGRSAAYEGEMIDKCNIIICTPGRLLKHMDENPLLSTANLKILVLDEADKILNMGFMKEINAIIEHLPKDRQTLLFSATQTKSVKDLARVSLRNPVYVSVHEKAQHSTPESLNQSYIVCELEEKLSLLWSFIQNQKRRKILAFMTSCKQVRFVRQLFHRMNPGTPIMALCGTMNQGKRFDVYESFCARTNGAVLLATDVAARGLDFPSVDWVVQVDCPADPNEYIHRAGRTARHESGGEAILFMMPSEEAGMLDELKKLRIPINRIRVNPDKHVHLVHKVQSMLAMDETLKTYAQAAFVAYVKSIFLMKNKAIFDVTKLNVNAFADSLGLANPPRIRFLQKRGVRMPVDGDKNGSSAAANCDEPNDVGGDREKNAEPFNANAPWNNDDDDDDDDGGELLVSAKKPTVELGPVVEEELIYIRRKPLTKIDVAKKLLRRNPHPNLKVRFDDDGQVVKEESDKSDADEPYNIEKAKEFLKGEDKIDRDNYNQRIRAKKRLEKIKDRKMRQGKKGGGGGGGGGGDDDDDESDFEVKLYRADFGSDDASVDLDFLPDPDKIYGKLDSSKEEAHHSTDDDRDYNNGDDDEKVDDETTKKKKKKREMQFHSSADDDDDDEKVDDETAKRKKKKKKKKKEKQSHSSAHDDDDDNNGEKDDNGVVNKNEEAYDYSDDADELEPVDDDDLERHKKSKRLPQSSSDKDKDNDATGSVPKAAKRKSKFKRNKKEYEAKKKRKLQLAKGIVSRGRRRAMETGLSLHEDEELAMHILSAAGT